MSIQRDQLLAVLDDVELALKQDERTPTYISAILQCGVWSACIGFPAIDLTSVYPRIDGQPNIMKNGVKR